MQGSGLFAPGVPARGNISTTIMPGATATARAARATAQRARPRRRGGLRLAVALLVAAAAAVAVAVAARPTPVRVDAVPAQRGGFRDVGVAAGSEDSARAYSTGAAGSAAGGTAVGKGGEWRGHWLFESPAQLRIDGLDLSALEPRAGTAAPGFEKLALGALPPSIKSLRVRRHSTRTTACMPHVP